jgi:DNA-binding response OmpR family regulator
MLEPREAAMLLWMDGDEIKAQWSLAKPQTAIGRWQDNDIVMNDRWVSRYHAQIRNEGEHYVLIDLDSKNGTQVNGKRIMGPTILTDGDEVQVTPMVKLVFVDYGSTAPLPTEVQIPELYMDMGTRQVYVRGKELCPPLSHSQFTFLALLFEQPGKVYSREEVIDAVWPDEEAEGISDEAIDALTRRLRLRLRELAPDREHILTVRGYGFKIEPE